MGISKTANWYSIQYGRSIVQTNSWIPTQVKAPPYQTGGTQVLFCLPLPVPWQSSKGNSHACPQKGVSTPSDLPQVGSGLGTSQGAAYLLHPLAVQSVLPGISSKPAGLWGGPRSWKWGHGYGRRQGHEWAVRTSLQVSCPRAGWEPTWDPLMDLPRGVQGVWHPFNHHILSTCCVLEAVLRARSMKNFKRPTLFALKELSLW